MNKKQAKKAFTLAELLITLSVIGLVAILTIPTMIENHQQKAWNTASTVFERKLEEALKSMNTQETLAGHANTLDFVNELSKHIKINKICKNDNLMSCFEDKGTWNVLDVATKQEKDFTFLFSDKQNASDLGQDWNTEVIGLQFANGITGLLAYNPICVANPYSNQFTGRDCIALIYDTSAFKKPNTFSKDIRSINTLVNKCTIKLNGKCLSAPFYPLPVSKAECEDLKMNGYGIEDCLYENDYWAGAVKICGGTRKMPSMNDIYTYLAPYLYDADSIYNDVLYLNYDKVSKLGLNFTEGNTFTLATGSEWTGREAFGFVFDPSFGPVLSRTSYIRRNNSTFQALCFIEQ